LVLTLLGAAAAGEEDLATLRRRLRSNDAAIRASAAEAIGKRPVDGTAAVPELAGLLADPAPPVRIRAALALSALGEHRVEMVPPLAEALRGPDAGPRTAAADALARIGAPAVAVLVKGLRHVSVAVRREAVRSLAAKGVKVAIFDMNEEKGQKVAGEVGGVFCKCNVTSEEEVDAAFAKAREAHGQERILVNCAGTGNAIKTASRDKNTGETKHFPLDAFNFIIQINLVGTFRCIAKSAKGMLDLEPMEDGERGVIINTASVAAEDGQMGQAAYSASKGGVVGMTLPIARDLSGDGIRVNTILPGIFNTPLMQFAPEAVKQGLAASVPFPKRLGKPEEYAQLALTMIECGYFNGEDVRLDGAIRMAPR